MRFDVQGRPCNFCSTTDSETWSMLWIVGSAKCPVCPRLIKDILGAFVSADGDEFSLEDLKTSRAGEKAELKRSIAACKD